jgi:hypothetical protein
MVWSRTKLRRILTRHSASASLLPPAACAIAQTRVHRGLFEESAVSRLLRELQLFDGRPQLPLQQIELGLCTMLLQAFA